MLGSSRRALATVMASLLVTGSVAAQPAPTDAQKRQAGDLTKKAIAKSQAGDHQAAINLYLEAYAIVPLPVLLSNVGAEYQKLEKPVESLKYFCMYLEKDPTGPSASYATAQAKTLQIDLGRKNVTDDNVCAPEPEPTQEPVAEPTPEPAPTVSLAAAAPPAANPGSGLRLTGLALGGAGLVAAGVGVYFGLQAKDISDQISNHPMNEEWPADIRELEERGQAHENKQIIFLAAGGALAVTGTVLYFVGRARKDKGKEQAVAVTPTVTPGGMGLVIGGGF